MSYIDLEEDYENLYKDGWRPDPHDERIIPVGKCRNMCSLEEMQERETHQRLNKYEIEANSKTPKPRVDFKLAIKEFKRSSVGREFTSVDNLRPWSVLKKTLRHLLLTICFTKDDWMHISDFVFDRLKAVRQDMVIQRIEGRRYIEVLEGSSRFLIYSMYKLTCTLRDYTDTTLPFKPIIPPTGPLKGLNNYEMHVVREMKMTMKCLRDCLNSLIIQYQENVPCSPYRPIFEAVNLIVNLPFLTGTLWSPKNASAFVARSELRNSDSMFKSVYKMFCLHMNGNHWSALKHLPGLIDYPLIILAYAPAIAYLQVHSIPYYKKLYSSPGPSTSSVRHLCALICPEWLDISEDERIIFGMFIATQFGIYDEDRNLCDYKLDKIKENVFPKISTDIPKFIGRRITAPPAHQTAHTTETSESDNETRAFALQMLAGKNWSFFKEVVNLHGLEYILDPAQT